MPSIKVPLISPIPLNRPAAVMYFSPTWFLRHGPRLGGLTGRCYTAFETMPTLGVFAAIFDKQQRVLCDWTMQRTAGRHPAGESPIEALEREVLEEAALEIAGGELLGVYSKPQTDDLVLSFAARVIREHPWRPTQEIGEIGYFPIWSPI
jgi:NUDIX domain